MVSVKNRQLRQESESWFRMLDYFEQENIQMKNRLAEILKNEVNVAFLEKLEFYQNKFLNKDTVITLFRHEIAKHDQTLTNEWDGDVVFNKKIIKRQSKLRQDLRAIEREFNDIKFDFNSYVAEALPN